MVTSIVLAALAVTPPVALRVEAQSLGRGSAGTVVGIVIQVAPEDRNAMGERIRVEVSFSRGGEVVDRGSAVVALASDGSAMVFREWPVGEGKITVAVESLDGQRQGAWAGPFVVTAQDDAFEPPAEAPPDAIALAVTPAEHEGVAFMAPPRTGGIGALQLQLAAPGRTARVEFFQDDQPLIQRQRPPWTVSVSLGSVPRRTIVRGVAYAADGGFIGEDALVLNGPANQVPVEILLGPKADRAERLVTVSVAGVKGITEVLLKADDKPVARWLTCPCVVRLPADVAATAKVLVAEATAAGGRRGEAVRVMTGAPFAEEVKVEQVELPVVVQDAAGRPVTGLPREAFRAFEDGREVTIDSFGTTAELPLSLGILVDTSRSMLKTFGDVRRAVAGFARDLLRPTDAYFLSTFSFEARVEVPWTQATERLVSVLDRIVPDGGTALHDAVVMSLEQLRPRRGRIALVLLSDGDDTASRTTWEVALRYCRTARAPIFPIGFRISIVDFAVRGHLKDLAEATGGQAFFVSGGEDLAAVYREISEQLRSQYLISYRSQSTKGVEEFRTVRVEVSGSGLTPRTIAGYYPGW